LNDFFIKKVAYVRTSTDDADDPVYSSTTHRLSTFSLVSNADVGILNNILHKQCQLDPMPTWLLEQCSDIISPFITSLINCSLSKAEFPAVFKSATITPLLKKPGLDSTDVKHYRPISNLSVHSKLIKRIVAKQLVNYLNTNDLFPDRQSSYRKYHSTETALAQVLSSPP
jgi:hypothetical protein